MQKIDPQKIVNVLQEQRNEAFSRLAEMTAYARTLEEQLKKQVESDKGDE
jgi:hypothetical protein